MGDSLPSRFRNILLSVAHVLGSRTVVILGLMLAVWTGYSAAKSLWFVFSGRVAKGVVVRHVQELSAESRGRPEVWERLRIPGVEISGAERAYRAVVAFSDGGISYDVAGAASATTRAFPVGSKVEVVFPPGRPERARLRPDLPDSWAQAGLLLVATVLGAGSARLWWRLARRWMVRRRVVHPESMVEPERVADAELAEEPERTVGPEQVADAER